VQFPLQREATIENPEVDVLVVRLEVEVSPEPDPRPKLEVVELLLVLTGDCAGK